METERHIEIHLRKQVKISTSTVIETSSNMFPFSAGVLQIYI